MSTTDTHLIPSDLALAIWSVNGIILINYTYDGMLIYNSLFYNLSTPTSFPGSLIFPKRDPGLGCSRVFQILADSTDVLGGRGWKVKVCLALSLSTEPSRE